MLAEQRTLTTAWQPAAADPDDEALCNWQGEAEVEYLVTHNVNDVAGASERTCVARD